MFAAFSGSHQDAIAKGMKYRESNPGQRWNVPYIPIDPKDINRTYDADVIRVNSQSGKGGIAYILESTYGYVLPAGLREEFGYMCKSVSDREHRELHAEEMHRLFKHTYFNNNTGIQIKEMHFHRKSDQVETELVFEENGYMTRVTAFGNGSLDAISNALKEYTDCSYTLEVYSEHSMQEKGSKSVAVAYIGIKDTKGKLYWGAGTHTDIIHASADALLCAFKNMESKKL